MPLQLHRALSVVIPAYNEERRLPGTLEAVSSYLESRGIEAEILVVDDGSRDGTRAAAERLRLPTVRVLGYPRNRGKGYAVRTGVLAATRDPVLFTDADLSTPIEDLEILWACLDQGCHVAIASRLLAQSRILVRQPWHRRMVGRTFAGVVSLLAVRGFRDTQCGFKLFRSEAARRLFAPLRTVGFAFDVEVLLRARRLGLRVAEVPVRWVNSPDSRIHPVRDSGRMLVEILRMRGIL